MTDDEWATEQWARLHAAGMSSDYADAFWHLWESLNAKGKVVLREAMSRKPFSEDKMTHLEMLKKVGERPGFAFLRKDKEGRWSLSFDRTKTDEGGYEQIAAGNTPEEAIGAAYRKFFLPIPKKVGCWEYSGTVWRSVISGQMFMPQVCGGYDFSGYPNARELEDAVNLLKVDPELKAPTEE